MGAAGELGLSWDVGLFAEALEDFGVEVVNLVSDSRECEVGRLQR